MLVVDSSRVSQLAGVPRCDTLQELAVRVWRHRRDASFCPESDDEMARLLRLIFAGKRVVVLIDEAHVWLSAHTFSSSELVRLLRQTQHARTHVLLTAHSLTSDIPQAAYATTTELVVFRTTSPRGLDLLRREWSIDPVQARSLERGQFLRVRVGL